MKTQDLTKLKEVIESLNDANTEMLYKNLFGIGCYINMVENKRAGKQAINTVLSALGWENRKTYFCAIMDSIDGNENEYAKAIEANGEINELFENIKV